LFERRLDSNKELKEAEKEMGGRTVSCPGVYETKFPFLEDGM
jgi:hypothetical protein